MGDTRRERELQRELSSTRADLEERDGLLRKAQTALEELQQALADKASNEDQLVQEANGVIDEQAIQLRSLEEQLQELQAQLVAKEDELKEALSHKAKATDSADVARHQAQLEVTSLQARLKDKERTIAALQDDVAAVQASAIPLERALKEARARISSLDSDNANQARDITRLTTELKAATTDREALQAKCAELQAKVAELQATLAVSQKDTETARSSATAGQVEREQADQQAKTRLADMQTTYDARIQELERQLKEAQTASASSSRINPHQSSTGNNDSSNFQEREWIQRLHAVELSWEKRLHDGLAACEVKFAEEAAEWQQRVTHVEAMYLSKLSETEAFYEARVAELQHALDVERTAADSKCSTARHDSESKVSSQMEELRDKLSSQLDAAQAAAQAERAALEQCWSEKLHACDAAWASKFEAAQAKWASDRAGAAEKFADSAAEEHAATKQRIADLVASHAKALEAAGRSAREEREKLASEWQAKLDEAHKAAAETQDRLQSEMNQKVAAITHRLETLAAKESHRDASRAAMTHQLEELQATYEDELRRRGEAEASARESLLASKAQLQEQQRLLDGLQADLRNARSEANSYRVVAASVSSATAAAVRLGSGGGSLSRPTSPSAAARAAHMPSSFDARPYPSATVTTVYPGEVSEYGLRSPSAYMPATAFTPTRGSSLLSKSRPLAAGSLAAGGLRDIDAVRDIDMGYPTVGLARSAPHSPSVVSGLHVEQANVAAAAAAARAAVQLSQVAARAEATRSRDDALLSGSMSPRGHASPSAGTRAYQIPSHGAGMHARPAAASVDAIQARLEKVRSTLNSNPAGALYATALPPASQVGVPSPGRTFGQLSSAAAARADIPLPSLPHGSSAVAQMGSAGAYSGGIYANSSNMGDRLHDARVGSSAVLRDKISQRLDDAIRRIDATYTTTTAAHH